MDPILTIGLETLFKTLTDIFAAGIAITAVALLLFSLNFNIRERVIRSFILILLSVVIVFSCEALTGAVSEIWQFNILLRLQWVGIIILPASYLHFSDAVLSTTGKPSRWKRRWAYRIAYIISIGFLALIPTELLVGDVVMNNAPAPHLQPTLMTGIFSFYYLVCMGLTWFNFFRSYRRAATHFSKRRMAYLLFGALSPALGSFPFLLYGSQLAKQHILAFWIVASLMDLMVGVLLVGMAYSVAFFGVNWPDRVIKSRLFRWLMRGPTTASIALGLTTIVRRVGEGFGFVYTGWVPLTMVATVLFMEYLITILGPNTQRWLFYGNDQDDIEIIQAMEDRLLTRNDLLQFLEMILATLCDRLQANGATIIAIQGGQMEVVNSIGKVGRFTLEEDGDICKITRDARNKQELIDLKNFIVLPIRDGRFTGETELLGLIVVDGEYLEDLYLEQKNSLEVLKSRVGLALRDRITQEKIFQSLENLTPQVEMIQQLRAAGRYDRNGILTGDYQLVHENITNWVKDALDHYWGGPKLTDSPLIQLKIVQNGLSSHEGNPSNALRTVLKTAIDRLKPEGERRYISEWILYNILVMKFLEGKKVREIANRLAISEADLYRKQRIAISTAAKEILEMEKQAN
jgi:hypothetical protein